MNPARMIALTEMEKRATLAIAKLRRTTLQEGNPFLIYDRKLPEGQYYLEYPDGSINLVSLSRAVNDYIIEKKFTPDETETIRIDFNLTR